MILLKFLVIWFGIILVCYPFIGWLSHVCMNVFNDKKPYGFATFKRFLDEFNKYSNKDIEHRDKSIFVRDDKRNYIVYIHASIIEFNGIGMVLNPIDWWRFSLWIKKYNDLGSKGKIIKGVWQ